MARPAISLGSTISLLVLIILAIQFADFASGYQITDCSGDNARAKLETVHVGNCPETADKCPLVKGTNASIEIDYKSGMYGSNWNWKF